MIQILYLVNCTVDANILAGEVHRVVNEMSVVIEQFKHN